MSEDGGEAEGRPGGAPAQRHRAPALRRGAGEGRVPAHPQEDRALPQRLLQVFPRHPAALTLPRRRRHSPALPELSAQQSTVHLSIC